MKKILIVKTSSMGDVIHTLPALTDAGLANKNIRFDWVVEKPFAEIPTWHPLVDKVIPVEVRRWRKNPLKAIGSGEMGNFLTNLRLTQYDGILDAQGLMKSALIARLAKGVRLGLDRRSAWEPTASYLYQKTFSVNPELHAITRVRTLFGKALGYSFDRDHVAYGVDQRKFKTDPNEPPYVLFLHGTTWETKHWPESYWEALAKQVNQRGLMIKLPWSNDVEKDRANRVAKSCDMAQVLPRLNLAGVAKVIAGSQAVVSVDTGLGHLTAALDVPAVSLYGPTDPDEIGTVGPNQIRLQSNRACPAACTAQKCSLAAEISPLCFKNLTPDRVVEALNTLL